MSNLAPGSKADMLNFSPFSRVILEKAVQDAIRYNLNTIYPENILKAIAQISEPIKTSIALANCLDTSSLIAQIDRSLAKKSTSPVPSKVFYSNSCETIFSKALQEAIDDRSTHIKTEHLLLAIAHNPSGSAGMYLSFLGVTYDMLKNELSKIPTTTFDIPPASTSKNSTANTDTKASDTTSTVNTSCSLNCGCTGGAANIKQAVDSIVSSIAKNARKVAKNVVGKGKSIKIETEEYAKWLNILDQAIALSRANGVSVPSAFVEISLKNNEVVTSAVRDQIRQESLIDAAETVMRMS